MFLKQTLGEFLGENPGVERPFLIVRSDRVSDTLVNAKELPAVPTTASSGAKAGRRSLTLCAGVGHRARRPPGYLSVAQGLFTELPRRLILGKWAFGVWDSRELSGLASCSQTKATRSRAGPEGPSRRVGKVRGPGAPGPLTRYPPRKVQPFPKSQPSSR